jgi:hypothetical protein
MSAFLQKNCLRNRLTIFNHYQCEKCFHHTSSVWTFKNQQQTRLNVKNIVQISTLFTMKFHAIIFVFLRNLTRQQKREAEKFVSVVKIYYRKHGLMTVAVVDSPTLVLDIYCNRQTVVERQMV